MRNNEERERERLTCPSDAKSWKKREGATVGFSFFFLFKNRGEINGNSMENYGERGGGGGGDRWG